MAKRTSNKRSPAAVADVAAIECDGDGAPSVPDDDDVINVYVANNSIWDELRQSLSNEFLPIIDGGSLLKLLLFNDANDNERKKLRRRITATSMKLFRFIERLAEMEGRLKVTLERRNRHLADNGDGAEVSQEDTTEELKEPCSLSGIPSLYVGEDGEVDAETIWGQVDLQNAVLIALLKKQVKTLAKRADAGRTERGDDDMVRILRIGGESDVEEVDESEDEDDADEVERNFFGSDDENDDDSTGENDEERRIRERMERAMADIDDDDDGNDDRRINGPLKTQERSQDDDDTNDGGGNVGGGVDPTREELLDGFFDLHEMEEFADEEEEMLPDDAFGEEDGGDEYDGGGKKKDKKATLPHFRDRLGDALKNDDGDEYDEDLDENDPLSKRFKPTTVRRKKYRADDEVEALYKMYGGEENDAGGFKDDEEEDEADASTMTASDLFGKPSKKLIKKYKAKLDDVNNTKGGKKGMGGGNSKKLNAGAFSGGNDDDSWDNHNFEDDGVDWKENDEYGDDGDEDDTERSGGSDDGQEEEEEEPMKDDNDENAILQKQRKLSPHEIKSQKLQQQTERLEQDMMAEKPWKMMGEAKGTNREIDSLLESTPEFEVAFKPPPILTPQHATDIEEMIKKRIVEEDWDDVVPRELPDIGLHKRGGGEAPDVSQEKSKLGLGELYEREYLKKTAGFDRGAVEKQTEEDSAKEEMKHLFANLCSQLDALSNYHFAPRPVADEADVRTREDLPAIAMEEVLPLHVSKSRAIAPEEVHAAGKGRQSVLKGESELDQVERKRLRGAKKAARRKVRQQKHADEKLISKLQPGLGLNNPYEKRKLREELQMARASGKVVVASDNKGQWKDEAAAGKEYQTSTKFFAKMQENVESMVHVGVDERDSRAKKRRKGVEAVQSSSVYKL